MVTKKKATAPPSFYPRSPMASSTRDRQDAYREWQRMIENFLLLLIR